LGRAEITRTARVRERHRPLADMVDAGLIDAGRFGSRARSSACSCAPLGDILVAQGLVSRCEDKALALQASDSKQVDLEH